MLAKFYSLSIASLFVLSATPALAGVVGGRLGAPTLDVIAQEAIFEVTANFEDGGDLSGISLDVRNSTINGGSISDYSVFSFTPNSALSAWNVLSGFGNTATGGSPYFIEYGPSSYRIETATPLGVLEDASFSVGYLTFAYGELGLTGGDEFTINIEGILAPFASTSVSILPKDELVTSVALPLTFDGPYGPGTRSVTLPSSEIDVPEPTSLAVFGVLGLAAVGIRRRVVR